MENVNKKLYPHWNEHLHRLCTKRIAADIVANLDNLKDDITISFS